MDFNETQQDILVRAWALARDGNGQVVTDEAIPDAHRLCEAGCSSAGSRTTAM